MIANHSVERVSRGGRAGLARGRGDIALRGRHRFVAQELHQRVHAHIGVRELGRVGVPEPVDECAADRLGVLIPRGGRARRTRDWMVPRVIRCPSRPTNSGTLEGHRGKDRAALRISWCRGTGPPGYRASSRSPLTGRLRSARCGPWITAPSPVEVRISPTSALRSSSRRRPASRPVRICARSRSVSPVHGR